MAAVLHLLDQRRLIDSNGISDGGSIAFYLTGTTTPSTIYSDVGLTTPLTNPVVVGAGAAVPSIYLSDAVTYRRVITYADGSTDDTDPYTAPYVASTALAASGGSALVGYIRSETDAEATTLAGVAGRVLSLLDFVPAAQHAAMYARTSTYDATADFQAAVDALGAAGGTITIPNLKLKVTGAINITQGVFIPVTIKGSGATRIVSTHDGIVFNDSTLALRVLDLEMEGPGLANTSAIAIKSGMTRGSVERCKIFSYRLGIDATGTSGAWVVDNQIALCQEGIRIKSVSPAFSNIIMIAGNYIDYNTYGVWAEEVYGIVLDSNAFEYNSVGLYTASARKIDLRGSNWFEANTANAYQITGASTGRIGRYTHIVGNDGTIAHATSVIIDETRPALAVVKRAAALNVSHNLNENIAFDTETLDPSGLYSSSVFTIQTAGTYEISANAELASMAGPGATNYCKLMLNINNGGSPSVSDQKRMIDGVPTQLNFSVLRKLANGDTIRIQAYQNSGGNLALTVGDQTSASVRLVEPA